MGSRGAHIIMQEGSGSKWLSRGKLLSHKAAARTGPIPTQLGHILQLLKTVSWSNLGGLPGGGSTQH